MDSLKNHIHVVETLQVFDEITALADQFDVGVDFPFLDLHYWVKNSYD